MELTTALRLLARAGRYRWKLNRPEIERMLRETPRGGMAIDVGAHKGAYTFWLARAVGRNGRVLAVEPQEHVAAALRRSLRAWGFSQAEVIQAAASNRSGQGRIHIPRDSTHGASLHELGPDRVVDVVPVRLLTIDELVADEGLPRLDFVKIDAQGAELEIVEGGLATFARHHPSLLVEAEARAHGGDTSCLDRLCALLAPLGYSGFFNDGHRWLPVEEMDVAVHQNYGHGRFCNNIYLTAH